MVRHGTAFFAVGTTDVEEAGKHTVHGPRPYSSAREIGAPLDR